MVLENLELTLASYPLIICKPRYTRGGGGTEVEGHLSSILGEVPQWVQEKRKQALQ